MPHSQPKQPTDLGHQARPAKPHCSHRVLRSFRLDEQPRPPAHLPRSPPQSRVFCDCTTHDFQVYREMQVMITQNRDKRAGFLNRQ